MNEYYQNKKRMSSALYNSIEWFIKIYDLILF